MWLFASCNHVNTPLCPWLDARKLLKGVPRSSSPPCGGRAALRRDGKCYVLSKSKVSTSDEVAEQHQIIRRSRLKLAQDGSSFVPWASTREPRLHSSQHAAITEELPPLPRPGRSTKPCATREHWLTSAARMHISSDMMRRDRCPKSLAYGLRHRSRGSRSFIATLGDHVGSFALLSSVIWTWLASTIT